MEWSGPRGGDVREQCHAGEVLMAGQGRPATAREKSEMSLTS
jgi:hypothetical protein